MRLPEELLGVGLAFHRGAGLMTVMFPSDLREEKLKKNTQSSSVNVLGHHYESCSELDSSYRGAVQQISDT